jgi:hypothetical protein
MNHIYVIESYDLDGNSIMGAYTDEYLAILEAKQLFISQIEMVTEDSDKDLKDLAEFNKKEYLDAILSQEGYSVLKIPVNTLYFKRERIFDTYKFYVDNLQ